MYLIERCTVYEVRDGKPEMYVFWRRDGIAARGKSQMEVMHDDLCAKDVPLEQAEEKHLPNSKAVKEARLLIAGTGIAP